MPLFEYRCSCCGKTDERLVRTPAPETVDCPACGSEATRLVPLLARTIGEDAQPAFGGT